jgi:hypothetical protein
MGQCKASTKKGHKCSNLAMNGSNYCYSHKESLDASPIISSAIGGLLGNMLFPGIGGIIFGSATGALINKIGEKNVIIKKKVFVSFDFDNDKVLKGFVIGQSKLEQSPFMVIDHSLKEAAPEANWKDKARAAIKRSDIVMVIVGPETYRAPGVLAEIAMARQEGKPVIQLIGYRNGEYRAVENAGRLYRWTWENLRKLLA